MVSGKVIARALIIKLQPNEQTNDDDDEREAMKSGCVSEGFLNGQLTLLIILCIKVPNYVKIIIYATRRFY